MAQITVAFLSTPEYPQHVGRTIERLDQMVSRAFDVAEFGTCDYQSPESRRGACDGGDPCSDLATITHRASGLAYCTRHFRTVELSDCLSELEVSRG